MIRKTIILLPAHFINYSGEWLIISGQWDNTGIWRNDATWIN